MLCACGASHCIEVLQDVVGEDERHEGKYKNVWLWGIEGRFEWTIFHLRVLVQCRFGLLANWGMGNKVLALVTPYACACCPFLRHVSICTASAVFCTEYKLYIMR